MQHLVEAENIDGLIQMKDVPDYVNNLVLPSYELLIKLEEEGIKSKEVLLQVKGQEFL